MSAFGYNPMGGYYNPNGAMGDSLDRYKTSYYQQPQGAFTWVLDENEARNALVPRGCTSIFWSRDKQEFYVKSVDAQGMPSFDACVWQKKEPIEQVPVTANANFVDRGEFEKTVQELRTAIEEFRNAPKSKKKTESETEVTDNG